MTTMTLTWLTVLDNRVCALCQPLHNHTWTFDTTHDAFPTTLYAGNRAVWDCVRDKSIIHPNCRCHIVPSFDLATLADKLQGLLDRALDLHGHIEYWSTGQRLVLRRHGRFVTWRPIE